MKVCTDACLFGAWAARSILQHQPSVKTILDIGSGTGLLSLMLAQKMQASIDAIEINSEAAEQSAENIMSSPWKNICVYNTSIEAFKTGIKYDLVISNPPFYESSLLSPDENRNAAMHDSYLTLELLLSSIMKFISSTGYAAILLPISREAAFTQLLARHKLCILELARVRQSVHHSFFRSMFIVSPEDQTRSNVDDISIHNSQREYTDEFKELLKDYYLKL